MFGLGTYSMRLIDHTEDRKRKKCRVCSKSFKGKYELTQHMKQ